MWFVLVKINVCSWQIIISFFVGCQGMHKTNTHIYEHQQVGTVYGQVFFCTWDLPLTYTLYSTAGLLESVRNLTVTPVNSISVLISWSPPFTLEGVPILGYNITITNNASGKNKTMLVEDTTLLYSIDHSDSENNFTVTVVPINEVGAGQPAALQFLCKYE